MLSGSESVRTCYSPENEAKVPRAHLPLPAAQVPHDRRGNPLPGPRLHPGQSPGTPPPQLRTEAIASGWR